jgi:hypothetical protein
VASSRTRSLWWSSAASRTGDEWPGANDHCGQGFLSAWWMAGRTGVVARR